MPELVPVAALSEDQSVTVYATSTGTKYQPPKGEDKDGEISYSWRAFNNLYHMACCGFSEKQREKLIEDYETSSYFFRSRRIVYVFAGYWAPIIGAYNNSAFKIFISLGFLVIMGLFIVQNTNIKKGTPEYEMVKGALLLVVASILVGVIGYNFWF